MNNKYCSEQGQIEEFLKPCEKTQESSFGLRALVGDTFKDDRVVNCHPLNLSIPYSSDGEVSLIKEYSLKAIINHSGSAGSGHYWTTLFNKDLNCWLSCDDKSVTRILPDSLNSRYSYVYLYTSN